MFNAEEMAPEVASVSLLLLTLPAASPEEEKSTSTFSTSTSGDVDVNLALTNLLCIFAIVDPPDVLMIFIGSGAAGMEEAVDKVVGGASIGANVASIPDEE